MLEATYSFWTALKTEAVRSFEGKDKDHPRTGHEGPEGGVEGSRSIAILFL
jgi:hypothetical protein